MSAIQNRLEKMETFFDQKEVVVIDNGTGFIKAGFAGEDMPRVIYLDNILKNKCNLFKQVIIPTIMGQKTIHIEQNSTT